MVKDQQYSISGDGASIGRALSGGLVQAFRDLLGVRPAVMQAADVAAPPAETCDPIHS